MRYYKGMTLIGMLLTMATVIIAGILLLRVVPVYIHHFEVVSSVKALNTLPPDEFSPDPAANANVLRTKLLNQLYVNSIESIKPEQIMIEPKGENKYNISIKYHVVQHLIANVRLLFDFKISQEVKISAQ